LTEIAPFTPLVGVNDDYVVVDMDTGTVLGTNLRLLALDHVKFAGLTLDEVLSSDSLASQLAADSGTDLYAVIPSQAAPSDPLWAIHTEVARQIMARDAKAVARQLRAIWPQATRFKIEDHGDGRTLRVHAGESSEDLWNQIRYYDDENPAVSEEILEKSDDLFDEAIALIYNPDTTQAMEPFLTDEGIRHEKYTGQIITAELDIDKILGS